jgi:phage-related minor tail protein
MADRIKGITVEIGGDTTGLSKALSGVNKEIGSTQSQLRQVERLLKLDPTNTELLQQKQRLLAQSVEETKTKLNALKQAESQAQQMFKQGQVSVEQYEKLQREIISTEESLKSLEKQAKNSNTTMSKISTTADKIGNGASKVSSAMMPVTKAIGGLGVAVAATVPATEELRSDLSKLDVNAQQSAVSIDVAREAYRAFAVASDEVDSSVEATSNLLQAGFTESNLQIAVEGLTGAYLRFPDTLKIESLADSLQETLATGQATGQFGELLDRLGIGAANFSEELASMGTEAEKQNYVLETLAQAGLNDTYEAWIQNNKALTENKDANMRLQESLSELANTVQPVITAVVNKLADLLNWFNNLSPEAKTLVAIIAGLVAAIGPVAGLIVKISGAIKVLQPIMKSLNATMAANPILAIVAAITALVAAFMYLWQNCEAFRQFWINLWENIKQVFTNVWNAIVGFFTETIPNAWQTVVDMFNAAVDWWNGLWQGVGEFFKGIWDGICSFFTQTIPNAWNQVKSMFDRVGQWWNNLWQGVSNTFKRIWDGFVDIAKAPINGIIGLINAAIGGINWMIDQINKISFDMPDWLGGAHIGFSIGRISEVPYLAKGGTLSSGSAIVGEKGPELLTMLDGGKARVTPLTNSQKQQGSFLAGGITINIDSFTNNDTTKDIKQLTEYIMDEINMAAQRKAAVFS